ncbi:hypothetical protein [Marinococcus sp. PL1-022]|uniref:hypothetical protein n=1 Tax=Marinococcus sp. PL1-022 TaxID=3095363 RepID=UPI0029C31DE6|nr:hypothetical protein [Marinococcus sp. PL1-022]MDX6154496.1 hypothetical protein [Marinococcus sp. PL1-022]
MRHGLLYRTLTSMVLSSFRFVTYMLIGTWGTTPYRNKRISEAAQQMKFLEELLIKTGQLNEEGRKGSEPAHTKADRKVIHAFVSQRDQRDKKDFYIYVARAWVKELERKSIRTSIKWACLNAGLFVVAMGFVHVWGSMTGILAGGFIAIVMICSLWGIYHALRGQGWQRVLMVSVHGMIFYPFLQFLLAG